jgi:D-glycero-alpha-D-manno-heptose-7-phosphate kinase
MIVTRTPLRISLFGGGTDYPAWYRVHGGAVLSAAIDKYCWLTCRHLPPFFEHRIRVVYSRIESCQTVDEIRHPAVRAVLRFLGVERGVDVHHDGDLPARSGMGSSSAFTVGLLHALHALLGRLPSREQLASEAIHVEQEVLRETVGSQDQVMAAHGGLQHVTFAPTGTIGVQPVPLGPARAHALADHLMLFYTGIARTASEVADSYVGEIDARRQQLRIMKDLVHESLAVLQGDGDLAELGTLLHESWLAKRSLSPRVSNPRVDEIYAAARAAGALGGKLTGAGGGGFMLLFAPPERRRRIRERLSGLIHVPFQIEFAGSQVIFFAPEQDYAAEDEGRARITRAFEELADVERAAAAPRVRLAGSPS